MRPDCDLDAAWEFRPDGIHPMSMHDFEEIEVIQNAVVSVLKCRKCGKISVGWSRGPLNYEEEEDFERE